MQENPKVEISVMGGNTQTILEALVEHRVQLCLIEGPAMRRDVQVEPFMEDHMVCVVPAGHEWADEEVDVKELQQATLVSRELGSGSRRIVEQALEKAGLEVKKLRLAMTFDSTEGLLSAVEAGLGIAFVSRWAVRNQLALGTLKLARVRGLNLARMFSLATVAGPEPAGIARFLPAFCARAGGGVCSAGDRAQGLSQRRSRDAIVIRTLANTACKDTSMQSFYSDGYAVEVDRGQGYAGNNDPEGDALEEWPDANLTQRVLGKTGSDQKQRGSQASLAEMIQRAILSGEAGKVGGCGSGKTEEKDEPGNLAP